jgi:methyl-accepting chemotaxis protein
VDRIALSIREQTSVSQEMASSIEQIARMAEANHSVTDQSAKSAGQMQDAATQLNGAVAWFGI